VIDRISANLDSAFEVDIYTNALTEESTTLLEKCMTSYEKHKFDYQITLRGTCMSREFKKEYVAALCVKNSNVSYSSQMVKVRVKGYQISPDKSSDSKDSSSDNKSSPPSPPSNASSADNKTSSSSNNNNSSPPSPPSNSSSSSGPSSPPSSSSSSNSKA